MPIFFIKNISPATRLGIWKIEETEDFFSATVPISSSITHPKKRLQHFAGRYLLRYLFPDFPYEEIKIADTRKPFLPNEAYHFSISHTGDYAAAIVSKDLQVGIDIETQFPKISAIQHKFLSQQEMDEMYDVRCTMYDVEFESKIRNQKSEIRNQKSETRNCLTLAWAAKEAMFKWYGLGNVDFKEMLLLEFDKIDSEQKLLPAKVSTGLLQKEAVINYEFLHELVLAYIIK